MKKVFLKKIYNILSVKSLHEEIFKIHIIINSTIKNILSKKEIGLRKKGENEIEKIMKKVKMKKSAVNIKQK